MAAANLEYHLLSHYSDVDRDGFDVILDDLETVARLQLKTLSAAEENHTWDDIHKYVLRPHMRNVPSFGEAGDPPGGEGALVVIEFAFVEGNLVINYLVSNIYIIAAIAENVIPRHHTVRAAANGLLQNLRDGLGGETVNVTKKMCLRVETTDNLLSMLEYTSSSNTAWRSQIRTYVNHIRGEANLPLNNVPLADYPELIRQSLLTATGRAVLTV